MKYIFSFVIISLLLFSCAENKKIELTATALETAISQGFPYEYNEGVVKAVVESPDVRLEEGRIFLKFPFSTRGLLNKDGDVFVSGIVNYDKINKSLYVDELSLIHI